MRNHVRVITTEIILEDNLFFNSVGQNCTYRQKQVGFLEMGSLFSRTFKKSGALIGVALNMDTFSEANLLRDPPLLMMYEAHYGPYLTGSTPLLPLGCCPLSPLSLSLCLSLSTLS
jgi:hypothetical protein